MYKYLLLYIKERLLKRIFLRVNGRSPVAAACECWVDVSTVWSLNGNSLCGKTAVKRPLYFRRLKLWKTDDQLQILSRTKPLHSTVCLFCATSYSCLSLSHWNAEFDYIHLKMQFVTVLRCYYWDQPLEFTDCCCPANQQQKNDTRSHLNL